MCGARLLYVPDKRKTALPDEGMMVCEHNHRKFAIVGTYGIDGVFHYDFQIPQVAWR
jgi:hypothetical protein